MKKAKVFLTAAAMSALMCMTSFAGQWMPDDAGWWYQNADGSYLTDGWYWVNGSCYYFDSEGYIYANETTPDGYTVDGSGAWLVDGVPQTRPTEMTVGAATVSIPNGYDFEVDHESNALSIEETNGYAAALVMTVHEGGISDVRNLYGDAALQELSDELAPGLMGVVTVNPVFMSKDTAQYANGTWYHYVYRITESGITMDCHMYLNYVGNDVRMVVTLGENREFSPNQFVSDYIK